eukprot:68986-Pelagomonas_calceolata.AAC.1
MTCLSKHSPCKSSNLVQKNAQCKRTWFPPPSGAAYDWAFSPTGTALLLAYYRWPDLMGKTEWNLEKEEIWYGKRCLRALTIQMQLVCCSEGFDHPDAIGLLCSEGFDRPDAIGLLFSEGFDHPDAIGLLCSEGFDHPDARPLDAETLPKAAEQLRISMKDNTRWLGARHAIVNAPCVLNADIQSLVFCVMPAKMTEADHLAKAGHKREMIMLASMDEENSTKKQANFDT